MTTPTHPLWVGVYLYPLCPLPMHGCMSYVLWMYVSMCVWIEGVIPITYLPTYLALPTLIQPTLLYPSECDLNHVPYTECASPQISPRMCDYPSDPQLTPCHKAHGTSVGTKLETWHTIIFYWRVNLCNTSGNTYMPVTGPYAWVTSTQVRHHSELFLGICAGQSLIRILLGDFYWQGERGCASNPQYFVMTYLLCTDMNVTVV